VVTSALTILGDGRMGRAIAAGAEAHGFHVVGLFGRADRVGIEEALAGSDVAIEVSTPESAVANVELCLAAGCPVVVGTTGWYEERERLRAEVEQAGGGLLWAANFSIGAALMRVLAERVGRWLADAPDFDVALIETHHTRKLDAPSGTARVLADAVRRGGGRDVPITSVRTGHVPGIHELTVDGPFEHLSIRHEARDRRVFADGALRAASWLRGRTGWYTMDDMLQDQLQRAE
jgi:4-hydroxy-tetrahydrodipicolinate reductase